MRAPGKSEASACYPKTAKRLTIQGRTISKIFVKIKVKILVGPQ